MTNMKRNFWILGIIMFIGLGVYGVQRLKPQEPIQGKIMLKYTSFETKNPALDFTFEYPETGWKTGESQGGVEKYDLVYLRGPVDEKTRFTTLIHITVRPLEAGKTASDLLKAYLKIDSNLSKFEVSHEETFNVGGEKAFSALCGYEAIPSYDLSAPVISFKKQLVLIVRNGRSYEFTYNTFASQFDAYLPILKHLLKTFQFKK